MVRMSPLQGTVICALLGLARNDLTLLRSLVSIHLWHESIDI